MKLIFAQGNPEPKYTSTRHNVGFAILNTLAEELGISWSEKTKLNALMAEFHIDDEKILFVKPTTYYNETGLTARKIVDFYKIDTKKDLLVIHDDLNLPLGTIRIRQEGNDGGNNGIKSINASIGKDYHRIRVGISNDLRDKIDDADFVLSKFSKDENAKFEELVVPKTIDLIKGFIKNDLSITSYKNIE